MAAYTVPDAAGLRELLDGLIPHGSSVGVGDSVPRWTPGAFGKNTPCAVAGRYSDCNSPERICNSFAVIRRQLLKDRIKVIFVVRPLGY